MKLDFSKYIRGTNFVQWAVIHLMTVKTPNLSDIPEFNPIHNGGKMDITQLDISVKINGIEVDFLELLTWVEKNADQSVLEKAKELLSNQFYGIQEKLDDLERAVDTFVQTETDKLK